jgi:hydrogenase 3 maturation protease
VRTLAAILKRKLENAARIAVLGVGSDLRGDDVAGVLAAQMIEKASRGKTRSPEIKVFIGATAPENLTGEIKRFQPSHLVIIDSADFGGKPGQIAVIEPEAIGGISFCTHTLPIKVMSDYLLQSFSCQVIVVGIQPRSLAVGGSPSKETLRAAKQLSVTIAKLLKTPDTAFR